MTQTVSSSQRHGYCTLGEAFNRLDFSSAILDSRRFNYVVRVSERPGFILLWWWWKLWTELQLGDGKHWQREVQACKWGCWAVVHEVIDGSCVDRCPNLLFDLLEGGRWWWQCRRWAVLNLAFLLLFSCESHFWNSENLASNSWVLSSDSKCDSCSLKSSMGFLQRPKSSGDLFA